MLFARLDAPSTFLALKDDPIWDQAIKALGNLTSESPLGTEWLIPEQMYLNVHTYFTKPRKDCLFEGHQKFIDIQYMIKGGELIDWAIKSDLKPVDAYDQLRDFQSFLPPQTSTCLHLLSGHFAVFFAEDAHCPQISDGTHPEVYKAVVKIDHQLFEKFL